MADLADINLLLRSESSTALSAVNHDANLTAIQAAVNAINAKLNAVLVLHIQTGAKVGATAGWSVNDGANRAGLAKCPASQTAATLVVPLSGLPVGWTLTGYTVRGQVESASGAVTLDAALRKLTVAAGDLADAAVSSGAIAQVSVTADAAVSSAVTGLSETLTAGVGYYLLLTATTAGSTDIDLLSIDVTVRRP